MADENDTRTAEGSPVPPRRASRKAASKTEAAKGAFGPAIKSSKKPAAKSAPKSAPERAPVPEQQARADRARETSGRTIAAVSGKRGLIVGGLAAAAAGVAAAALLSLRGSSPKNRPVPANDPGSKAHQPDGTDSSGQMEAMIADESMIPESTP